MTRFYLIFLVGIFYKKGTDKKGVQKIHSVCIPFTVPGTILPKGGPHCRSFLLIRPAATADPILWWSFHNWLDLRCRRFRYRPTGQ